MEEFQKSILARHENEGLEEDGGPNAGINASSFVGAILKFLKVAGGHCVTGRLGLCMGLSIRHLKRGADPRLSCRGEPCPVSLK